MVVLLPLFLEEVLIHSSLKFALQLHSQIQILFSPLFFKSVKQKELGQMEQQVIMEYRLQLI
jgi:hypothetical protein